MAGRLRHRRGAARVVRRARRHVQRAGDRGGGPDSEDHPDRAVQLAAAARRGGRRRPPAAGRPDGGGLPGGHHLVRPRRRRCRGRRRTVAHVRRRCRPGSGRRRRRTIAQGPRRLLSGHVPGGDRRRAAGAAAAADLPARGRQHLHRAEPSSATRRCWARSAGCSPCGARWRGCRSSRCSCPGPTGAPWPGAASPRWAWRRPGALVTGACWWPEPAGRPVSWVGSWSTWITPPPPRCTPPPSRR
ncbi:hypothetical protein PICSAR15_02638 [Mycobacterium avium subsp. paratuberculosis]|nr:hypothetical protein MAP44135_0762 [Mycobacterium avium subsp. paratuberculosis]CAG6909118.1 hypothetical protein PICSAR110_03124 [Mycobacterium avium subsp. paratuberculosis]CAG6909832.1 hypothetical protein PICSAR117_03146 [Mycobacterium avium subsp. paratuberculosis]CAG6915066.1 hypothetical protein PICSAR100_03396 [Mycobacterium avium subsp. paratuberculosis]CAG6915072.1 hypothetical protein PICSAR124B_03460 [Mycobacterium avium subsp. paratuberculosis]